MRTCVLILSIGVCLYGQPATGKEGPTEKGLPPRATPKEYQVQGQAGDITIAAEFTGHSLPTMEGPLTNEEYVGVELALFGPAGAQLKISASDFSLRVNGKKTPTPSEPFVRIVSALRDPEWVSPEQVEKKSKSSIGSGGGQGQDSGPPRPPKVPVAEQRAWAQRVQRASLPEGERPLPQAGLLFFSYRGKEKSIESVELIYEGPAGKATLKLQ
jgi:hypothetical protein